ncbi:DnaJ C-terminal domain-containing protein [Buchananella hordeovulneris]|uniref:Molecular chaperone DnaJ n=1 Tax=Buchananella hordeovulneris TaxID=52770 RepID=A0A1Q5PUV7_9ACTO|nr:DnaJ C-terminal domain-containing protein [Buchananella hordeovulneris]MDO5080235.1 DnaJ C-terminal domain-containing protein [Buchananella hordeovulneris]OKL51384.1 molecular chaperone DnaJ [Buchananella hordeovulneris]RRD44355.1 J domain-containing protein [Buchananella hordeovulneris]RRD52403.1 J domain-containing protein [Buchananella hordeovulneris]
MTGQDWLEKDFYAALGVAKDADAKTIKSAYRKLARELHPDHNKSADAEERFKNVGEAYAVLSDPEQRQQYDALRAMAGGGARFRAGSAGGAGFEDILSGMFGGGNVRFSTGGSAGFGGAGGFEDILSGMFGGGPTANGFGGGFPPGEPGRDIRASVRLGFFQALDGDTVTLSVGRRSVKARIPAGVETGKKIRLRGKGEPGGHGAPAGDLIVTVEVEEHPVLHLVDGRVRMRVPLTLAEALLGAVVEVPKLDGTRAKVKVPAGTQPGTVLRVKGGASTAAAKRDLYVEFQLVLPTVADGAARQAAEDLAAAVQQPDPRAELAAAVQR